MAVFKVNYNFPRFERGRTFSRGGGGGNIFPAGGGGGGGGGGRVKMLISIETHITCDSFSN